MFKKKINEINNWILVVSFLLVAYTGIVLFLVKTLGISWAAYLVFGLNGRLFIEIHDWSGVIFVIGVLIHLILHLKWFKFSLKKTKRVLLK